MLDMEITLMRHNGRYLERLLVGIPEDRLDYQPATGSNTPLWILGHLTVCNDYPTNLPGEGKVCPQSWHDMFGPFTFPHDVPADAPTVAEMLPQFATVGEPIANCLTNHAATHLGQFSAWRRMLAMPSV